MDINISHHTVSVIYITTENDSFNSSLVKTSDNNEENNTSGRKFSLGIFFAFCIFIAISGNLLVCVAVLTERRLKRVKNNYFIVSLAVADLLVACVVMSFAMANDIQNNWIFGSIFCRIWISFDIMCSTASILNLCVISFDRYKHIQNAMYYDSWMTTRKALTLIASVWFLSGLISFLPIHLGLHEINLAADNETKKSEHECTIKLNFIYAIISSTVSFYVPCLVMLILYFKLFLFARKHALSIKSMKRPVLYSPGDNQRINQSNSKIASDNKAAFTLGIITGVFLCCWLPFFIINPISAFNTELIQPNAFVISTWFGYINSCLNPIIYSIFNAEFRDAFKKILSFRNCCRNISLSSSSRRYRMPPNGFNSTNYETQETNKIIHKNSRDLLFKEKVTNL